MVLLFLIFGFTVTIYAQKPEQFYHFFDSENVLKNFHLGDSIKKFELIIKKTKFWVSKNKMVKGFNIPCNIKELLLLNLKLEKNNLTFEVPLNVSCGLQEAENVIKHFSSNCNNNHLNSFWNMTKKESFQYVILFINNDGYSLKYFKTDNTSYSKDNIQCTQWHKICLASIDNIWRTSQYQCTQHMIYPNPVTNLNAYSMTNEIYVFWGKLKEEIHEGYVVTINLPNGGCRTTIVNMQHYCINVKDNCRYRDIIRWDFIMPLKIKDLSSNTAYKISVSSVIRNKQSVPETVSVTTRIKESINNLQISENVSHIIIHFSAPSSARNINLKYRVKISLHGINMCTFNYKVIFDDIIDETQLSINTNFSNYCFDYEVEVLPLGQCVKDSVTLSSDLPKIEYVSFSMKGSLYNKTAKSVTLENITVSILSGTLLKLSWANNISIYKCNNFGFMIELLNAENENDCKTWILTRTTCTTLLDNLNGESKCQNKEYFNFQSEDISTILLLHGNFKISRSYYVIVRKITDIITEILRQEIKYENIQECAADCFGPKTNEITDFKGKEISPKKIEDIHKNLTQLKNYRANLCYVDVNSYVYNFCFNERNGDKLGYVNYTCNRLSSDNNCMKDIQIVSAKKHLLVKLPQLSQGIKGYIILLHNANKECLRYVIKGCFDCIRFMSMKAFIQKFYSDCKLGSIFNVWNHETSFADLDTHTEYLIYIIPLLSEEKFGQMSAVIAGTTITDKIKPNFIKIDNSRYNLLKFTWNSYKEETSRPYISHYVATLVNTRTNIELSSFSKNEVMEFNKLESCTKYCFYLTVVTVFELSELVDFVCGHTSSSNLGLLRLNDIESGPSLTRIISWTYNRNDDCARLIRVEVFNLYQNKTFNVTSNGTSVTIYDLVKDLPYRVRVRIETYNYMNKGLEISDYTDGKVFFTGYVNMSISYANIHLEPSRKVLRVYWQMENSTLGSMYEYVVRVTNHRDDCLSALQLICQPSMDLYKKIYLSYKDNSRWDRLIFCSEIAWNIYINSTNFFGGKFTFSEALFKSEVTIYGLNILGIHKLYVKVVE